MEFVDLTAQQKRIRDKIEANIQTVLKHGKYIMGPEVKRLEDTLSAYVGVRHAIGCASGTDALLMSLMAYNVGPGDVIFTTPFTFISTADVISLLGATPVFVDIEPGTFNLDAYKVEKAIMAIEKSDPIFYPLPETTSEKPLKPRGIISVDLFGLPADYQSLKSIARKHELFIIQDAAQSFGGEYKEKKTCSQGDISCTSFFPAKPLGCYGDGGMCFTDDDSLAHTIRSLRIHGKGGDKYDNVCIGINGRLDTLQAAILLAKFEIFPEEIELRQGVSDNYTTLLSGVNKRLSTPSVPEERRSAWAQYSVMAENETHRAVLQDTLKKENIPTAIYYPKPLHLQTAFYYLGYKEGDFPVTEDCVKRIFSLPMHPYLRKEDQRQIADVIKSEG